MTHLLQDIIEKEGYKKVSKISKQNMTHLLQDTIEKEGYKKVSKIKINKK